MSWRTVWSIAAKASCPEGTCPGILAALVEDWPGASAGAVKVSAPSVALAPPGSITTALLSAVGTRRLADSVLANGAAGNQRRRGIAESVVPVGIVAAADAVGLGGLVVVLMDVG